MGISERDLVDYQYRTIQPIVDGTISKQVVFSHVGEENYLSIKQARISVIIFSLLLSVDMMLGDPVLNFLS